MSEHIAIVGSRPPKGGYDSQWVLAVTRKIWGVIEALPHDAIIVSGGATGVDSIAAEYARQHGLQVQVFRPDWDAHGKGAGARRNQQIVDTADRVIAFYDGTSRGTKITIDMARRAGKSVEIVMIP